MTNLCRGVAKHKSNDKPVQADGQAEEQWQICPTGYVSKRAAVKLTRWWPSRRATANLCRRMAKQKSNGNPVQADS